jgi:hypothetical protein
MRLSWNEIRARAARFADDWKSAHYEKGETQTFYNEFFEIFGVTRKKVATFEEPVKRLGAKNPGFIDLFWKGTLLVEQKSAGLDLTKARQQAFDYFPGIKDSDLPRFLLVCDFQNFELYDLETRGELRFPLGDLGKHVQAFSFILGATPREFKDQDPVNIKASELMGKLHDALLASGYGGHDLERFLVRLVFCLFADVTGIFAPRDIFQDFVRDRTREDGTDTGPLLAQLFDVLNTRDEKRLTTLDDDLKQFPYVNGDLFAERLALPAFDANMRTLLLDACAFSWEAVSPAIFGALFQSVMDKKKRRAIGAHYTTEQNIMKVIQPLFLDDLRAELNRLKDRRDTGRTNALKAFQEKLAAIRCFDPACGCGNFLVIAYRELRALETEVLIELNKNRQLMVSELSKVDVDQFYGIELEEFPGRIAEIALWMMDHIMNVRLSDALGGYFPRIPLKATPVIKCGTDALEIEWATVLDPKECSYVLGNPPFAGAKYQNAAQRAQIHRISAFGNKKGTLDYVAAWFFKAGAYIQNCNAHIGFVATNSITQGEQVGELWPALFQRYQLAITFAHRTFAWGSEARGKANVHVVIIGLSKKSDAPERKRLFDYNDIKGAPSEVQVRAISPYLFDAGSLNDPDTVVLEQARPPAGRPRVISGTQPVDFEQYVLDDSDKAALLKIEPGAAQFIRPYIGSDEFINGLSKWIIALQGAEPQALRKLPELCRRMEVVRAKRKASGRKQTNKIADTPTVFNVTVIPTAPFLVIPKVSSERREYIPIAYLKPPTIPSDLVFVVKEASPELFAILVSRMHMAWVRYISGRLKSDYRYSIGLAYNPFPWPEMNDADRSSIQKLADVIVTIRESHSKATLADLYDHTTMPPELRKAHEALDVAVERLYRKEPFVSDRQRVEFLLALYEKYRAPLMSSGAKPGRRKKAA